MPIRLIVVVLILMMAVALGLIAVQVTRRAASPAQHQTQASQGAPAPLTVNYLVAAHALPAGTLARDEDFGLKSAAPEQLPAGALVDSPEIRASLHGALVRRYIDPGMPVSRDDVIRVRDRGFLAAVLEPGTRAVSISVDAATGVAGLIWPGDRVDVILTQDIEAGASIGERIASETVLSDIRVIAVDQDIAQGAEPSAASKSGRVPSTVTLQVTPENADKVAVAQHLGHLSLAVRAIDDGDAELSARNKPVFSKDVSSVLAGPSGFTVRVIEGDEHKEVVFH
jgi:pilus assembly protein CpaB